MITLTEQEKAEILSKCKTQSDIQQVTEAFKREIKPITCFYTWKKTTPKWPEQILLYFVGQQTTRWMKKIYGMPQIASRPGTREECIDDHFRWRYKFMSYKSWKGLIEDELACGTDPDFIWELLQQQHKFPFKKLEND